MMTSNTALKKSMTTWPFSASVPKNVPKTRQKKTMPRVFVPLLYCITLINSSSSRTSADNWSVVLWNRCFFGTYTVCACEYRKITWAYVKLPGQFLFRCVTIIGSTRGTYSPVGKPLGTSCRETCFCKITIKFLSVGMYYTYTRVTNIPPSAH